MRIGIDLDGVVYDYVAAMRQHFISRGHHRDALPDPVEYHFWESWGITSDDFWAAADLGIERGTVFGLGDPYQGAIAGMHWLNDAGHTLHIVTARRRTYRAISLTASWLERHGAPYKSLTFASDKTTVPVDMFVEDNVDNARAVAATGALAALMDRPWNQGDPGPGVERVHGWLEVVLLAKDHAAAVDPA